MSTLSISDYRLVLFGIKYIPVIMFLIMFIHTGLLLMGINLGIADTIVGCAIEAAMVYWFADEDCMAENKIVEHFK